jgi:hypothetical protein
VSRPLDVYYVLTPNVRESMEVKTSVPLDFILKALLPHKEPDRILKFPVFFESI